MKFNSFFVGCLMSFCDLIDPFLDGGNNKKENALRVVATWFITQSNGGLDKSKHFLLLRSLVASLLLLVLLRRRVSWRPRWVG